MPPDTSYTAIVEDAGLRLDLLVPKKFNLSRSQAQKLMDRGLILVNSAVPKKYGQTIRAGDAIVIAKSTGQNRPAAAASNDNAPSLQASAIPSAATREPRVIAETADYLVVEKPAGLLTHTTEAREKNTLAGWLAKKYPEVKKIGDQPAVRPGIVHRLDKEASGLLVVARTQPMFEHLKNQFKARTVRKEYLALVHGRVAKDWGEINFPIARGQSRTRMAARPATDEPDKNEREAKTEFLVEKRFANCTLLRVTLHTGRMHQIRVHMLAYNHPLVGDPLYFQKKRKDNLDKKYGRLFLHAAKLSFTNLDGQRQIFTSPLPKELEAKSEALQKNYT